MFPSFLIGHEDNGFCHCATPPASEDLIPDLSGLTSAIQEVGPVHPHDRPDIHTEILGKSSAFNPPISLQLLLLNVPLRYGFHDRNLVTTAMLHLTCKVAKSKTRASSHWRWRWLPTLPSYHRLFPGAHVFDQAFPSHHVSFLSEINLADIRVLS